MVGAESGLLEKRGIAGRKAEIDTQGRLRGDRAEVEAVANIAEKEVIKGDQRAGKAMDLMTVTVGVEVAVGTGRAIAEAEAVVGAGPVEVEAGVERGAVIVVEIDINRGILPIPMPCHPWFQGLVE